MILLYLLSFSIISIVADYDAMSDTAHARIVRVLWSKLKTLDPDPLIDLIYESLFIDLDKYEALMRETRDQRLL